MNSAARILKLVSYLNDNKLTLELLFNQKYGIDTSDIFENLNFIIRINKEIEQLDRDLTKINKRNNDKYSKDLTKLYSMFSIKPIATPSTSIINPTELGKLIVRLEGLEDLLESKGIHEEIVSEDNINKIIEDLDSLIEKIEDLENDDYLLILKVLNEIRFLLDTYELNGVNSIEESLEKLFCKSDFLSNFISPELKKDFNQLVGNLYGVWNFAKKYGRKPIEYAKKQYDEKQLNEDVIDVVVEEQKTITEQEA